mmetsp:Transcript_44921/g.141429  ORF Transcript_44921/g.141429 Transcript_44921/m.141429 type:complete len:241 (+) Transcript_44921:1215-1937(+)
MAGVGPGALPRGERRRGGPGAEVGEQGASQARQRHQQVPGEPGKVLRGRPRRQRCHRRCLRYHRPPCPAHELCRLHRQRLDRRRAARRPGWRAAGEGPCPPPPWAQAGDAGGLRHGSSGRAQGPAGSLGARQRRWAGDCGDGDLPRHAGLSRFPAMGQGGVSLRAQASEWVPREGLGTGVCVSGYHHHSEHRRAAEGRSWARQWVPAGERRPDGHAEGSLGLQGEAEGAGGDDGSDVRLH